jgi:hypothetical protein
MYPRTQCCLRGEVGVTGAAQSGAKRQVRALDTRLLMCSLTALAAGGAACVPTSSGYDTKTLVEDIRAFLELMQIHLRESVCNL